MSSTNRSIIHHCDLRPCSKTPLLSPYLSLFFHFRGIFFTDRQMRARLLSGQWEKYWVGYAGSDLAKRWLSTWVANSRHRTRGGNNIWQVNPPCSQFEYVAVLVTRTSKSISIESPSYLKQTQESKIARYISNQLERTCNAAGSSTQCLRIPAKFLLFLRKIHMSLHQVGRWQVRTPKA